MVTLLELPNQLIVYPATTSSKTANTHKTHKTRTDLVTLQRLPRTPSFRDEHRKLFSGPTSGNSDILGNLF